MTNLHSALRLPCGMGLLLMFSLALGSGRAAATVYYVDGKLGDDAHSGASRGQAWRSLDKVNSQVFQPGDQILFKSGTAYHGQLQPHGSGRTGGDAGATVVNKIGRYGSGALPRIDGDGQFPDTLLLRNVEYWDVEELEISNLGTNRQPSRTGVRVVSDGFGEMRHIHLTKLFVHDVNGDLRKNFEGCGIFFENRGGNDSHFYDLLIENCHVARTDRNGICQKNGARTHSTHVVIRGNLLEDIGGDGIKLWGSDRSLIERNIIHGGRMRCDDYAAGIWPYDCDDTVIQFNEVSGMKGTKDGQGFDSDYLCHRSLFQYNYSHDNDGGFMLICTPGNSYNLDTIIRYNISQNDGINSARVFNFAGGAKNTKVYNNTIYIGPKQDLPLLLFGDWSGGNASNTQFYNNIFYVDGHVTYNWGKSTSNLFDGNVFFGGHSLIPPDAHGVTNRPGLRAPGSGRDGLASLSGYQPLGGREFPTGILITNNGGRDFFGHPVPADRPSRVGAAEFVPAKTGKFGR